MHSLPPPIRKLHRISRVLLVVLGALLVASPFIKAAGSSNSLPNWVNPSATTLRQVSVLPTNPLQEESVVAHNLNCSPITYRYVNKSTMQTGCFTSTALGLVNSDNETVIFNGTDEAVTITPYLSHGVLIAVPGSNTLADIVPLTTTDGAYIGLYANPVTSLQDQRSIGQLTGKVLTKGADEFLTDSSGMSQIIDSDSIAFSDNGEWLIIEVVNGSFIRVNLETLEETAFAPSYHSINGLAPLHSQIAVSDDGQYVAINNKSAAAFNVYDLGNCSPQGQGQAAVNRCKGYDYHPFIAGQITGLQSILHVRFVNDSIVSFEAYNSSFQGSIYELSPQSSISSLTNYLGLGDSYTAGEGAFDYFAGTDTPDNMCHLSLRSYPLLLSRDVFGSSGRSVACSGAIINDIGSTSNNYRGQVRAGPTLQQLQETQPDLFYTIMANFTPGYVSQQLFVRQYQPGLATVSVGGNDIGYGDILQICVEPHLSISLSGNTCLNTYEDRVELTNLVDRTVPRWTALYKELLSEDPGLRLYAIGYPQIALANGDCGLNVHLSSSELGLASDLIDYLNNAIHQAATAAGIPYVDISQALAGHRLCEASGDELAMNGLTAGKDAAIGGVGVLGKESYHPNAFGQELIEQAILQQTHNFTNTNSGLSNNTGAALLSAPTTGRPIAKVRPVSGMTDDIVARGNTITVSLDGPMNGLASNTTYSVLLGGNVLASLTSNTAGNLSGLITVPASTTPGGSVISISGKNQADEVVRLYEPIYIASSAADADGDGINDTNDSCPTAINSGIDSDKDGTDDACDGFLNTIPVSPTENNTLISDNKTGGGSALDPIDSSPLLTAYEPGPSLSTNSIQPAEAQTQNAEQPSQSGEVTVPAAIPVHSRQTSPIARKNILDEHVSAPTKSTRLPRIIVMVASSTSKRNMLFPNALFIGFCSALLLLLLWRKHKHHDNYRQVSK